MGVPGKKLDLGPCVESHFIPGSSFSTSIHDIYIYIYGSVCSFVLCGEGEWRLPASIIDSFGITCFIKWNKFLFCMDLDNVERNRYIILEGV